MNKELQSLYEADVEEHAQGHERGTAAYQAMRERDQQRRQRISALMVDQDLWEAVDYFHTAQIFQHGDTTEDAWNAYQLALQGTALGEPRARWMTAAAYDRWLMYQGKPQKYGTNYVSDGKHQRLWEVDPTTTDADRAAWDVPPLAEQNRKAEEATRLSPPIPVGDDAPQWLKDAIERWKQPE